MGIKELIMMMLLTANPSLPNNNPARTENPLSNTFSNTFYNNNNESRIRVQEAREESSKKNNHQQGRGVSLEALCAMAEENSLSIKSMKAQISANQSLLGIEKTRFVPDSSIVVNESIVNGVKYRGAGLSVGLVIDYNKLFGIDKKIYESRVALSKENLRREKIWVKLRVIDIYYQLLTKEYEKKGINQLLSELKKDLSYLSSISPAKKEDEDPVFLKDLELTINQLSEEITNINNSSRALKGRLSTMIYGNALKGRSKNITISYDNKIKVRELSLRDLILRTINERYNPELIRIKESELKIQRVATPYRPKLNIGYQVFMNRNEGDIPYYNTNTISATISVKINRKQEKARKRALSSELESYGYKVFDNINKLLENLIKDYDDFQTQKKIVAERLSFYNLTIDQKIKNKDEEPSMIIININALAKNYEEMITSIAQGPPSRAKKDTLQRIKEHYQQTLNAISRLKLLEEELFLGYTLNARETVEKPPILKKLEGIIGQEPVRELLKYLPQKRNQR